MAEVLGTTDLHTIGAGSSILPSATRAAYGVTVGGSPSLRRGAEFSACKNDESFGK